MTNAQLNLEFRPYYTVQNNYKVWHDYAVIKLNYLFESSKGDFQWFERRFSMEVAIRYLPRYYVSIISY